MSAGVKIQLLILHEDELRKAGVALRAWHDHREAVGDTDDDQGGRLLAIAVNACLQALWGVGGPDDGTILMLGTKSVDQLKRENDAPSYEEVPK